MKPHSDPPRGHARWPSLPPFSPGRRIGLLGGSFNPPHEGHRHVSLTALRRLRLDAVWWLVTPGNPLKDRAELAALDARVAAAERIAAHPRIRITSVEADIGLSRTRDTLRYLRRRCPGVRFVWIMGGDNLAGFDRWHAWHEIAGMVPIGVVDRPGWTLSAVAGKAAQALARRRIDEADAALLAGLEPPRWVLLHGPRSALSSTQLRDAGGGAY